MYYRFVFCLLLLFLLVAYIDTKSLKESLDATKFAQEYDQKSKIIGIGLKNNDGNIKVKDILSNTPAARSNLEVGDILVNIDGKKISSIINLKDYLKKINANREIILTVKKQDNRVVNIHILPVDLNLKK